ncbi:MAG: hypothetical protein HOL38_03260, partial [Verrucomicrobia bacterium]|nr:hypothetical protein [Verrucomicrobiota bacterium]
KRVAYIILVVDEQKFVHCRVPSRGLRSIGGTAGFHNAKKKVALAKREN